LVFLLESQNYSESGFYPGSSEHESGKSARVEFQIENLEIESEDAEDDENDEEN
jgi:hypothetical protein